MSDPETSRPLAAGHISLMVWEAVSLPLVVLDAGGTILASNPAWKVAVPSGGEGEPYPPLRGLPVPKGAAAGAAGEAPGERGFPDGDAEAFAFFLQERLAGDIGGSWLLPWRLVAGRGELDTGDAKAGGSGAGGAVTCGGRMASVRLHRLTTLRAAGEVAWLVSHEVLPESDGEGDAMVAAADPVAPLSMHHLLLGELAEARQAARVAQKAKSEFLSAMGHEIRTPMNAIIGIAHMLRQSGLTPPQRDLLQQLHASAHDLLALLNDVLDVTAVEAGRLTLCEEEFHLDSLVQSVISCSRQEAREKKLPLSLQLRDGIPNVWRGDVSRLHQILHSLLDNAVKFTDRGAVVLEISLEESEGHCSRPLQPGERCLAFVVRDSGIGMPEEVQRQLFVPFLQGDGSHSRRFGGTGLGLALAWRLAHLMEGELRLLESAPGRGSSFVLWVPLKVAGEGVSMARQLPQRGVPGFDLPQALRRLDGDFDLFKDLLAHFLEAPPLAVDQLRPLLDSGKYLEIERQTHSLKGVAASLGAVPLAKAAEAVMRTARAQDREGILATLVALRKMMNETQESARALVALAGPPAGIIPPLRDAVPADDGLPALQGGAAGEPLAAGPVAAGELPARLTALLQLLENNAIDAVAFYEPLREGVSLLAGDETGAALGRSIHHLDFSTASEIVRQIAGNLEKPLA